MLSCGTIIFAFIKISTIGNECLPIVNFRYKIMAFWLGAPPKHTSQTAECSPLEDPGFLPLVWIIIRYFFTKMLHLFW